MNHNPEMLLRIAQADAFCVATEYINYDDHKDHLNNVLQYTHYYPHPSFGLTAGQYTDDTQMSIAVAETLIQGRPFTKSKFADKFVDCFKRDERKGYSKGFQKVLEHVGSGQELIEVIDPSSDRNGAAMRSVPLGVISDVNEMLDIAELQAKITHHTSDGILSSQAVAMMSHYYLHNVKCSLLEFLDRHLPEFIPLLDEFKIDGPVKPPRVGIRTAVAAHELTDKINLKEILVQVIEWGGDTDSVAAISWGIMSTKLKGSVPNFFYAELEPGGNFGPDYLMGLGYSLMKIKL